MSCTLAEMAESAADTVGTAEFITTEIHAADDQYACIIRRRTLPPFIVAAGRPELVATEVALHVEARIAELLAAATAAGGSI